MGDEPLSIRGRDGRSSYRRDGSHLIWRTLPFKAAAICAASVFLLGDAVGHVHQMIAAGNFAPGNAGVPFYTDIICPVLSLVLLAIASRSSGR